MPKTSKLPSCFTGELQCPLERCNKPSASATPIPAELSPALADFLFSCIESSLRSTSAAYVTTNATIKPIVDDALFGIALRHKSRQDFVRAFVMGGEEMTKLERRITPIVHEHMRNLLVGISCATNVGRDLDIEILAGLLSVIVGAPKDRICLHDVIDAKVDWRSVGIAVQQAGPNELQSVRNHMRPQALHARIEDALRRGTLAKNEWQSRSEWMPEVEKVYEQIMRMGSELAYEVITGAGQPFQKYQDILSSPDLLLRLLIHGPGPTSSSMPNDLAPWSLSPGVGDLIDLVIEEPHKRQSVLDRVPPPSKSLPANIIESLSPPPQNNLNSSALLSPFQRLNISPTFSKRIPSIPIFPLPQCCPPDRCTATQPPIAGNYNVVDAHLQNIFRNVFLATYAEMVTHHVNKFRNDLVLTAARQITSLAISDSNDALAQTALSAPSSAVFALMEFKGQGLFSDTLDAFRAAIEGAVSRDFCQCKMTRCCKILGEVVRMTGSAAKVTVRKLFDYLPGRFTPLDAGFVVREIEGALRVGETTADCWSARDWKPQLRIWLQRATEQVQGKLMDQDGFTEYCASFDDCWRIIGSAALLQSAHGLFGDLSLMNLHQFYIDMRADTPTTAIKIKRRRLKADVAGGSTSLDQALYLYQSSVLSNPSDAQARLNASAIRLRLVNDSHQSYQWSRAINDCTMAIYYGPPNFEAYYRRGFALAHLGKYKKAILDFEQALLLEPQNPVALLHLALARKNKHA